MSYTTTVLGIYKRLMFPHVYGMRTTSCSEKHLRVCVHNMCVNICQGYRVAERKSHLCVKTKWIYAINVHAGDGKSVSMSIQGTLLG